MHARELVEIAALVCLQGAELSAVTTDLGETALSEYWVASRCRLNEWGRRLRNLGNHNSPLAPTERTALADLAAEITISQPLTRAVAALASAHDSRREVAESAAIGRNVLSGHNEALSRLRALTFARWPSNTLRGRKWKKLNSQVEQWTDCLLGYLPGGPATAACAFDVTRYCEFAEDAADHLADRRTMATQQLLLASLRAQFRKLNSHSVCGDLNNRIAAAALGLFGAELFDSYGVLRSTWQNRMTGVADDALGMIEELFTAEAAMPPTPPGRWSV
jgi:hypothetical protein